MPSPRSHWVLSHTPADLPPPALPYNLACRLCDGMSILRYYLISIYNSLQQCAFHYRERTEEQYYWQRRQRTRFSNLSSVATAILCAPLCSTLLLLRHLVVSKTEATEGVQYRCACWKMLIL